jgi:hypothetical protein
MTDYLLLKIALAFIIFRIILNGLNGLYWKPKFLILGKIINSKVKCFPNFFPIIMSVQGRYKERQVRCSFNAFFFVTSRSMGISMRPMKYLLKDPVFMVSYKQPTPNTVRQGQDIIYFINTGVLKAKEYSENDLIIILDELTQATEKLESETLHNNRLNRDAG